MYIKRIIRAGLSLFIMMGLLPSIGMAETYQYNNSGQLTKIETMKDEYSFSTQITYDKNGNMTGKKDMPANAANLLKNSDFESYGKTSGVADYWYKFDNSGVPSKYEVVENLSSSGKRSQHMSAENMNKGNYLNFYQDVVTKDNSPYLISGRMNIKSIENARLDIAVLYYDKENQLTGSHTAATYNSATFGWVTLSGNFNTPPGTVKSRVHVHVIASNDQASVDLYGDNFILTKNLDNNMLSNPGFENYTADNGVADGWHKFDDSEAASLYEVTDSIRSAGLKSQHMKVQNMSKGRYLNFYQDVAVEAGKSYTTNGRIYIKNLSHAKFYVSLHYFDRNNNLTGSHTAIDFDNPTHVWMTVSGAMKVPAGTVKTRVHIHVIALDDQASADIYADSFTVSPGDAVKKMSNADYEFYTGTINGLADGWNKYDDSGVNPIFEVSESEAMSGRRSQHMKVEDMGKGRFLNFFQDLLVKEGEKYQLEGALKKTLLSNVEIKIITQYFDKDSNFLSEETADYSGIHNNEWSPVKEILNVPLSATRARIHIHVIAVENKAAAAIYADQFNVISL
ncbi:carbohydrate binding domain-containing protein [Paenibacillus chitinolyticus]|uniref:carbohydrate binding domain-containing protein n=1 Tax=Paenibacillus chitinolyticus TaxID=79263 RepID=UPI003D041151